MSRISQRDRHSKAAKQLKRIESNARDVADALEWYDEQLRGFKEIVPGYDSVHKLTGYIKAWQNIVPECDTPQKLKEYIKNNGKTKHVDTTTTNLDSSSSFFSMWNDFYVPYCKSKNKNIYPFESEEEYRKEENKVINGMNQYGDTSDPLGFIDFFLWLKENDISLPSKIEVIL